MSCSRQIAPTMRPCKSLQVTQGIKSWCAEDTSSIPAGFPTVSTPVRMLQACLDETVSGVSVGRHEMLEAISHIDTDIDKMTGGQLVEKLAAVNLNTSGSVKMLKRRLKSYYKHLRVSQYHQLLSGSEKMQFDYLVVIDFEATCDESDASFVQEIIEFPAVLVDVKNLAVHGIFHSFCKPRVNPLLTTFCTSLTDIAQAKVDQAKDFTEVLRDFEQWLHLYQLGTVYNFAVVTDGSYDMAKFFKLQLELSGIRLPLWARQWVNIRKVYSAFNSCGSMNLQQMLIADGMQFQGRPHRGLDDTINIAAVALKLMHDGCVFTFNEYFCSFGFSISISREAES
ncbi:unnamed protein product [Candidula unifasciata]|uniref:Exonuclease domain-containing protein n=1 Tax=Candidula unifasciata TaxID=100452 RepID=A0A8S3ZXG9_9EUPU|nr:unnamed protein product [Candidula unifasciata]